jgi:hypothetical protein
MQKLDRGQPEQKIATPLKQTAVSAKSDCPPTEVKKIAWQSCDDSIKLGEEGQVATKMYDTGSWTNGSDLLTTGIEMIKGQAHGRFYWELELLSDYLGGICVGVVRPNFQPKGRYLDPSCNDAWFIHAYYGSTWGNGKWNDDPAGSFKQNDFLGMLLDLNEGSLTFFKNGVQHGPGYPAGSVTGPVVHALLMDNQPLPSATAGRTNQEQIDQHGEQKGSKRPRVEQQPLGAGAAGAAGVAGVPIEKSPASQLQTRLGQKNSTQSEPNEMGDLLPMLLDHGCVHLHIDAAWPLGHTPIGSVKNWPHQPPQQQPPLC